jgi:spore maturation protein SpmA/spore maturation protein SpmB
MALSRIWAAFIIVACVVAGIKFSFFEGQDEIFGRMFTGSSKDEFAYIAIGSPERFTFPGDSLKGFEKRVEAFGFRRKEKPEEAKFIITDNTNADSVQRLLTKNKLLRVVDYGYITGRLYKPVDGVIATCKSAVEICINLIGIMALFMGFMSIAEKAGGINLLSRITAPFFSRLFPEVPRNHPANGHMMMNFAANLLGLDNAATPFGIKSMESLQTLNTNKEGVASNAQIMFLCLHASGLTLIPVSIIAARAALKAATPTDIFVPCMIATFSATIAAMIMVAIRQRINLLQPVILAWVFGISAVIAGLVVFIHSLSTLGVNLFSDKLSNGLILLIFLLIVLGGLYKKINIFDAFIEGAKGGFETAIRIIPYLVGMLVAISLLRTSGTFDVLINGIKQLFALMGSDTRFVDGLPTALIKPMSGSGARGMMIDTMKTSGVDSFAGRLSCILQGSSDTTFYVIAVYFGAINIKNTRYAIGTMLLADLVGIITSIILCYLFFGDSL